MIMKRLFMLMAVTLASVAHAQNADQVVNEVMQSYMQETETPGAAVMIVVDGKPAAFYYGFADRDTKKPITKDTIFELGSITKVMTTLLMAQEVDFAKIKLKEPVTKYIPTLPASFSAITMRSLATHTSGLPFKPPADIKNYAEWEKYAADLKLEHPVDADYIYSNTGIGLIGQALESVTHQNYNQLYRTKILAPLGMQPIAMTVPKKLEPFYARGYDEKGSPVPADTMALFPAAGDMKASAEDMGKFLSAAIGLPNTPESIFYPMRMTQTAYVEAGNTDLGLGWQIHEITGTNLKALLSAANELGLDTLKVNGIYDEPKFDGNQLIDKSGTTSGFRCYIAVIPNKKTGIVILTNRRAGKEIIAAGREILFKLNGIA